MHPENGYYYFQNDNLIIIIVEGLSTDWKLIDRLNCITYLFNIVPYNLKLAHLQEFNQKWIDLDLKNFDYRKQIIWLMNTKQQVEWANKVGLSAILVNHNCWLDYNLYQIDVKANKKYTAVINSRPFRWKRIYLADLIEDLVYIKGADYTGGRQWQWSPWYRIYRWVNLEPIRDPNSIVNLLNQSKVGLILSGSTGNDVQGDYEGACYSCSEYLLCGLPVVSTISEGGRDVWLNSQNSIICQPDPVDVKEACDSLENISMEKRMAIRREHIKLQLEMRSRFISYTAELFQKYGVDIDPEKHFETKFINKMTKY